VTNHNYVVTNTAVEDFKRARKAAAVQQLMAKLTGKSADLLAYDDVRQQLNESEVVERGVQEIPLDAIVGSVGRYKDFTRSFLPKHDSDEDRWTRVRTAVDAMVGMPPIDVYKVGEVYFVIDGNHRVSVARQLGTDTITARVTEVKTRVSLTPDDDPDEIICKARYAEFLAQTNLDELRPDSDLFMTFCGQFRQLIDEIEAYQQLLSQKLEKKVPFETAVGRWYDDVYTPVVALIRSQGIMRHFPERTEADLYMLLSKRRSELQEALGWEIDSETAVVDMVEETSRRSKGLASRLLGAIVPPGLEEGPPPGEWRKLQQNRRRQILFSDYLVALSGHESDWPLLESTIAYAKHDNDRLLGLHVVPSPEDVDSAQVQALRDRFLARCDEADLVGEFAVEVGPVVDVIVRRARWVDLVVLGIEHPPGSQPLERLGSRFSQLVQRCPRPILAIPSGSSGETRGILLGYDGSPKAHEALYVATYLKGRRPQRELTVVTVETEYTSADALAEARRYLERHGVDDARYILRQKPIAEALLETAESVQANLLIMGGFGFRSVMHAVLGSTVDQILREFPHPILICR